MSQELQSEDRTILAVLEALEKGTPLPSLPPGQRDETAETLARLYTEVVGLLPSELTPIQPRPAVKARLLAQIAGDETQDVPPPQEPAAAPVSAPAPASEAPETVPLPPLAGSVTPPRPAPAPVAAPPAQAGPPGPVSGTHPAVAASLRPPARPERRPSRWPLALAAGLLLPLIGLALWLGTINLGQRDTIASLERQLAEERQRASQAASQVQQANDDMHQMRANLRLVTQPAVEVSPLRPVPTGTAPLQPSASGMLFVAPDHQHWYLSVEGLQPAGPGRTYQLWFVGATGTAVSGGMFAAQPGERAELSSKEMPADTKGVVITLEPAQGSAAPSGPEVLRAAAVYQIL